MKYNVYALVVASLFVGFGLNGSDDKQQGKKEERSTEIPKQKEAERTYSQYFDKKYTSAKNFAKEVVNPTPEKKNLNKGAFVNSTTGEELISDNSGKYKGTGFKAENFQGSQVANKEWLTILNDTASATKQRGFFTKERAQTAGGISMIVTAIYFQDEISSGISYAVKGTRNQLGRAAGWVTSWFKSSPKQDEKPETEQN